MQGRFLISSTSEVYGDPLQHPQTEEYWGNVNPIGERSCYDEGELVPEMCAHIRVLVFLFVYGMHACVLYGMRYEV